jgi:hypothetical protein
MNWLNNAWVVGIGTGIVSGLLVYWLLSVFLSKKKDREHQQLISTANREVIYSIRSGIPENSLPTNDVVEALIHSTARRYDLESDELYQPQEITEELVKEVMDSSFLSAEKKVEYCAALLPLGQRKPTVVARFGIHSDSDTDHAVQNFRIAMHRASLVKEARNTTALSLTLGVLAALTSGIFVAVKLSPEIEAKVHLLGKSVVVGLILALTIAAMVPLLFESAKKLAWLVSNSERLKQKNIRDGDGKNLKGDT